jgi:alkaline phosphatase
VTLQKPFVHAGALLFLAAGAVFAQSSAVIFNVDGASLTHWTAARMLTVGPDGLLNWDRLPAIAEFRTHAKDRLVTGSNPLNTTHAYGVKVGLGSYGTDGDKPLIAFSGKPLSIMEEAKAAGKSIGLINTADLTEGGTGVYLGKYGFAGSPERYSQEMIRTQRCAVARQMIQAKPDVMLGGGERYFLGENETGFHGQPGFCPPDFGLLAKARASGYRIINTPDALRQTLTKPSGQAPLLGLFAPVVMAKRDGFDESKGPSLAEMTEAAIAILSRNPKGFLLVINEEGVDDSSNLLDARGTFAALASADRTIGVLSNYIDSHPETLLVVVADAPAAGIAILSRLSNADHSMEPGAPLPERDPDGAKLEGANGPGSAPFMSKPDERGRQHPFAIAWATRSDVMGGVMARASGKNADQVRGSIDNTRVYRIVYETLFGRRP